LLAKSSDSVSDFGSGIESEMTCERGEMEKLWIRLMVEVNEYFAQ
jgi:hypothetical protein